jgi:tetratricopeptide (TPR) repeat protein
MVIGAGSVVHASSREFDAQLETAARAPASVRRELALRAEAAHPVDYYYALAQAAAEPIAPDGRGRSPRLHALNHALSLCPHCPDIHSAVAATLWALGRRTQALDEWHTAMDDLPVYYISILQQVWAAGARPEEIAVIAGGDPQRLIQAVNFLISKNPLAAARELLALAAGAGASGEEVLLLAAKLDIDSGSIDSALKGLASAQKLAPQDPRIFLLLGEAHLRAGRIDQALQVLDVGIGMNPHDLPMVRRRLEIIMGQRKWHLASNALAALESALAEAQQPTIELHLAAARYYSGLRDYPKASSEYNLVITQDPGNLSAWLELGALWEGAGRFVQALEAYRRASSMVPGNPTVVAAIARLESRIQTIRSTAPLLP